MLLFVAGSAKTFLALEQNLPKNSQNIPSKVTFSQRQHIIRAIEAYYRILKFLADLRLPDNLPNFKRSQMCTDYSENVFYYAVLEAEQDCITI